MKTNLNRATFDYKELKYIIDELIKPETLKKYIKDELLGLQTLKTTGKEMPNKYNA